MNRCQAALVLLTLVACCTQMQAGDDKTEAASGGLADLIMKATQNGRMTFTYTYRQMDSDQVKKHKNLWEYMVIVRWPGTRSEGSHGILLKDGAVVTANKDDKPLDTPFGMMKFCGDSFTVLWQETGWQPLPKEKK